MFIHDLKPNEGATKKKKRIGRGPGSGHGHTATKGHKGQKARSKVRAQFEGGQTPLHRRLPVKRGFRNPNAKEFTVLNLCVLEDMFDAGTVINPEMLLSTGTISKVEKDGLKILADGELTKAFTVKAHKFSKSAVEKIEAAGGTTEAM